MDAYSCSSTDLQSARPVHHGDLQHQVNVWTDGSFDNRTKLGGWAALISLPEAEERFITGAHPQTTSHTMEVMAATSALERIPAPSRVKVYVDCESLPKIAASENRKYAIRKGGEVAARLYQAIDLHQSVEFVYVRAHSGNEGNEAVDGLAKKAVRQAAVELDIPLRQSFGLMKRGEPIPEWP